MENADDFVAGWVSGVAGLVITQPVDYVLTRLQSGNASRLHADPRSLQGMLGMWRGMGPLVATVPLNNAMLMYGYGVGKSVAESNHENSLMPIFLGGCAGGFVQSFLQAPVELLKVRLQLAAAGEIPSTGALTLQLLRGGGGSAGGDAAAGAVVPPLLRQGLSATMLRDVVPHGVWFAAYDWIKRVLERRAAAAAPEGSVPSPTAEPPPLSTAAQLGAGSFAAVAAWVVGYPADVLKTRCQMEGGPSSLAEAARIVHAKGGFPAFYRGLGLKLLRAVPQSAVSFLAYERFMELLAKRHEKRD
jgi:solute carrier family 25 carnitine/acylcarnitine transporter 20/29